MLSVMLDKQQTEQSFKTTDITNAAKTNIISGLPKFDSFKITRTKLPNPSQNNILINRIKSNSKVKEVKNKGLNTNDLNNSSQSTNQTITTTNSNSNSQSSNQSNSSSSQSSSINSSSSTKNLFQNLQSQTNKIGANLRNLTKLITAQAAGNSSAPSSSSSSSSPTNTDWIPSSTNISFFDTSETQLEPFRDFQTILGIASSTDKGIGVTSLGSRFYIFKKDTAGTMSLASLDSNGNNPTPWVKQSGGTNESVTLASFNGKLFEGYVGTGSGQVWIRSSSDNSSSWSAWYNPAGRVTGHAFAMTQFKNQLCIMHNGYSYGSNNSNGFNDNNTKIYIGCSSDGVSFPSWESIPAGSYSSPSMIESGGYLFQTHRGMDKNQVWVRRCSNPNSNCNSWFNVNPYQTSASNQTQDAIAIANANNKICLMINPVPLATTTSTTPTPTLESTCTKTTDLNTFLPWKSFGDNTSNLAPALAAYTNTNNQDTNLTQFHIGTDNKINYRILSSSTNTTNAKRGYYSEMKWDNPKFPTVYSTCVIGASFCQSGAVPFTGSGYEQDVVIYYGSNTTPIAKTGYMARNNQANTICMPSIVYYFSNLPNYYLDTRSDNNGGCSNDSNKDETDYTIGTSSGKYIQAGKTYFNYWLNDKGQRDTPVFKVNAQLTTNNVPFCNANTWCMFPVTTQRMICFDSNILRGSNYPYWYKESNSIQNNC